MGKIIICRKTGLFSHNQSVLTLTLNSLTFKFHNMKKFFLFALLAIFFVSCSSDGSRELQIDEVQFVPEYDFRKLEECKNVCSILEVVPGKYELAWRLVYSVPRSKTYNISLKLKLRLNRTVKVKPEVMDLVTNGKESDLRNIAFHSPIEFCLVDANGKKEEFKVQKFNPFYNPVDERESGLEDKDKILDFLRFLQSKPGTEIELVMNACGGEAPGTSWSCVEFCKEAKGIVCLVDDDKSFESWTI